MSKLQYSSRSRAEFVCVCGFVVCVYMCMISNKCVYMQSIMHIVYSIACFYVRTQTDTSQPMISFHLSSQSPYSSSTQEEYSCIISRKAVYCIFTLALVKAAQRES